MRAPINISRGIRDQSDELTQVHSFRWAAPQGGYRWTAGTPITAASRRTALRFLIENSIAAAVGDRELDGALFREFSEVKETPEEILKFANTHGWLGISELVTLRGEPKSLPTKEHEGRLGEMFERWVSEIRSMKRLLSLWEQLTNESRRTSQTFRHHLRWSEGSIVYAWICDNETGEEVVASRHESPGLLAFLERSRSARLILKFYLQSSVNCKLIEHKVSARLLFDSEFERVGLTIVPTNLIGFLWLQFARAIQGNARYRRCEDCGKWFEYGGKAARSDKRFCSATCRVRTNRIQNRRKTSTKKK